MPPTVDQSYHCTVYTTHTNFTIFHRIYSVFIACKNCIVICSLEILVMAEMPKPDKAAIEICMGDPPSSTW